MAQGLSPLNRTVNRRTPEARIRRDYREQDWTDAAKRQGSRCAVCRDAKPLHSYYGNEKRIQALMCPECLSLSRKTNKELEALVKDAKTAAGRATDVADWRRVRGY